MAPSFFVHLFVVCMFTCFSTHDVSIISFVNRSFSSAIVYSWNSMSIDPRRPHSCRMSLGSQPTSIRFDRRTRTVPYPMPPDGGRNETQGFSTRRLETGKRSHPTYESGPWTRLDVPGRSTTCQPSIRPRNSSYLPSHWSDSRAQTTVRPNSREE